MKNKKYFVQFSRWSARSCVDKHPFICQHRMPYVSEKNRHRVYSKWNVTYPNEMANEVEVVINQDFKQRLVKINHSLLTFKEIKNSFQK